MRGLRHSELLLVHGNDFPKLLELPAATSQFIRDSLPRAIGFRFRDSRTLRPKPRGHLLVDGLALSGDLMLGMPELGLAMAELGFSRSKLLLEASSGLSHERRSEGLGELDLGSAFGADDPRLCHHAPHTDAARVGCVAGVGCSSVPRQLRSARQ